MGPIFFFSIILVVPRPAEAGFFSSVLRFLTGGVEAAEPAVTTAAISFPLLGSQPTPLPAVGGPIDNSGPALSSTQDNALVAHRNPAGTLPSPNQEYIFVYTVQPGDTPGKIAENFNISLNTLLWANNISNPNLIKVGDDLVILPVSGIKYVVKKGDTVESIAKSFKGDAADILSFNGLAVNETLEIGTELIIPDGELSVPTPPTKGPTRYGALPEYRGYYLRPILGGRKSRGVHGFNGVDLANSCGLPVLASAEGTALIARTSGWNGGYGKYVAVAHPNGTQTLYAHLSQVFVETGQGVERGNALGIIGSSGNSTGCHLHFEVRGARNPF